MSKSVKLVVFDLDGTLSRTELFSVGIHQQVQEEFGWPKQSAKQIISTFGAPASEYLEMLLPGADDDTKRKYIKRVSEVECDFIHLAAEFDGCGKMLEELHQKGYQTAVCSNASHRYISLVLTTLKLIDKIDYIQPLEPHMTSKGQSLGTLLKKVSPEKAIMVGDTKFDWNAANDNNIPFIGCFYGYRPFEVEDAENLAKTPTDIPNIAESIFS